MDPMDLYRNQQRPLQTFLSLSAHGDWMKSIEWTHWYCPESMLPKYVACMSDHAAEEAVRKEHCSGTLGRSALHKRWSRREIGRDRYLSRPDVKRLNERVRFIRSVTRNRANFEILSTLQTEHTSDLIRRLTCICKHSLPLRKIAWDDCKWLWVGARIDANSTEETENFFLWPLYGALGGESEECV